MGRILAIDYGDKNIGLAVSDELNIIATGLETVRRDNPESFKGLILRLREIIKAYDISLIVLGYPKNMDGTEGFRCAKTLEFKDRLHRNFKSMDIVLWDERLSSLAVEREMDRAGIDLTRQKEIVDKMAAVYILQGYMESI
ncbi:MAG: Holliday junction resolvase RuvX [Clostridiales bacterium]|jgi:putative Holliday junction resolvase|nr:Holliday junction resolvase RuvX [Clostridiales bacterium]